MAEPPNIPQILAALAAQRPNSLPPQSHSQGIIHPPPQHPIRLGQEPVPQAGPTHAYQNPYPQQFPAPQSFPTPVNTGNIDLSAIKPVNSGSMSISETRPRENFADRGAPYGDSRRNADFRNAGSSYRPSRSRSRSPTRLGREPYRDNFNPYREDRRADARVSSAAYGRDISYSPGIKGSQLSTFASPPPTADYRAQFDKLGSSRQMEENSEIISINSSFVGLIIGRSGENLRRVENDTKTRVQFVTPPDAGVLERECRISGNMAAREHAKAEINRIIHESGKAMGSSSGRVPLPPDRDMDVGFKPPNTPQANSWASEDSMQMMVPNRTVGLIIGKGGETIRDLQERSHCHVNILGEEKSVNGLRPVNLIGSVEAARKAKALIVQIVESDASLTTSTQPSSRENELYGAEGEKQNDRIYVPSDAVGMIIGKGGETIKEMQNATGCKINVSPASGRDVQRDIGLVGSRASIARAKNAIQEKVRAVQDKNRPRGGAQTPSQSQIPNQQQNYGPQESQSQGDSNDPYAAYGGYQNYVALWYSSLQANQGQQDSPAQGPPGS